jgi:hypothetical protein
MRTHDQIVNEKERFRIIFSNYKYVIKSKWFIHSMVQDYKNPDAHIKEHSGFFD